MLSTAVQKLLQYVSRFGQYGSELVKAIHSGGLFGDGACLVKTADYAVAAADTGKILYASTNAVNFTLPTIAAGLSYTFVGLSNANVVVTTNALGIHKGSIVAAAVTFSTTSEKAGTIVRVTAVPTAADGTVLKWLVSNVGGTTATVS